MWHPRFKSLVFRSTALSGLIGMIFASWSQVQNLPLIAIYISPHLGISSFEEAQAAITEPFGEPFKVTIRLNNKKSQVMLANCEEYVAHSNAVLDAGTNQDNQALWSEGVRCLALHKLITVKQAKHSLLPKNDYITADQLPPQIAVLITDTEISQANDAAAHERSLLDFEKEVTTRIGRTKDKKVHPERSDQLAVFGHGWFADLTIYARGDFDGDGFEDILLRRDGRVSNGTYGISELFVLTKTKPEGPFHVLQILPNLHG